MTDEPEIMMRFYESHIAAKHHHEKQCYSVTHCFLVVAGAALALAKFGGEMPRAINLLLGIFVIAIGVVGYWVTRTNYEACKGCDRLAEVYRRALEQKYLGVCQIEMSPEGQDSEALKIWPRVHGLITAAGIVLVVATLWGGRAEVLLARVTF